MDAFVNSQPPYHRLIDGTLQISQDGEIQHADAAFCHLIGMAAQDLCGRPWTSLFHPFDLSEIHQALQRFKEQGEAHLTVRCVRSDSTVTLVYLLLCRNAPPDDADGGYFCFVLNLAKRIDYTTEKIQFLRLFEISNDLLCVANTMGYFVHINPAFGQLLGYSREELLNISFMELVHPDDIDATLAEMRNLRSGIDSLNFENRFRCKDGSWRWLSWSTTASNGDGLLYAVARDINDQKAIEEQLQLQAKYDFVSGLPNRSYLFEELNRAMARVGRTGQYLALHVIQLDDLPQVQEDHGSGCADNCVREFALRLRRSLRNSDFAARVDYSTFVVVTEQDDPLTASRLPHRIHSLLNQPLDPGGGRNLQLVARMGHALYDDSSKRDPGMLLNCALADLQHRQARPSSRTLADSKVSAKS